MYKEKAKWLAAALIFFSSAVFAAQSVPQTISYQGRLLDGAGQPVMGASVPIMFSLYDGETGGSPLWSEARAVSVDSGIYSVILGDSVAIPSTVFSGATVFLEVTVNAETLSPRQRVTAVPYAMTADLLDGLDSTDFADALHGHDFLDLTGTASDAQVPDDITVNYALDSDRLDGLDATAFSGSTHGHAYSFADISGAATDAQVPDDITVNYALDSDRLDGLDSTDFSDALHGHDFLDLTGMASDAQVPDDITVNYALDSDRLDGLDATAFSGSTHGHAYSFADISGSATDAQVPDDVTINYALDSDRLDGLDATAFSGSTHGHAYSFADISGSATDAQVPDDVTINYALDSDQLDGLDSTDFADALHAHDFSEISGAVTDLQVPDNITISLAQDSDLLDGLDSSSFAEALHFHAFDEISGTVNDLQVPNDITINLALDSDKVDGLDASAFSLDGHTHNMDFSALTGTATDAQIPDDITIDYALDSDKVDGLDATAFAVSTHVHSFAQITGSVTDAQVPNTITINYSLDSDLLDGQHGSYYRNATNIYTGTLSTARYSAYSDLSVEGYLSNNSNDDLLTRTQLDSRYVNEWEAWNSDLTINGGNVGIGRAPNSNYGILNDTASAPLYGAWLYGTSRGVYGALSSDPADHYGYMGSLTYGVKSWCGGSGDSANRFGGRFEGAGSGDVWGAYGGAFGYGAGEVIGIRGYGYSTSSGASYGGKFLAYDVGTGTHYGVYAEADDRPVYAQLTGAGVSHFTYLASSMYGIWARSGSSSETGSKYGGMFYAYTNDTAYGVRAVASGYGDNNTYGVHAYGSNSGTGTAYSLYSASGTKAWVNPDPEDPAKSIVYATLEGGENGTYWRGTAWLENGFAEVVMPDHFRKVTSPDYPVTVTVTPVGECYGLMLVERSNERFLVKELMGGTSSVEFDFIIIGKRLGYEEYDPVIDNVDYIPFEGHQAELDDSEYTTQEWYDEQSPGVKKIFKKSGILDRDGKVNEAMFKDKDWKLVKEKKEKKPKPGNDADIVP